VNVPVIALLRRTNLAQLTERVLLLLAEPAPASAPAPRDDVALAEHIDARGRPFSVEPRDVLVTGASGFVGAFLLAELLTRTRARVRCLVRAGSDDEAALRLRRALELHGLWRSEHQPRIIPVAGDLSRPRLGLSEGDFGALAASVNVIYHAGALVNFLFPYGDVRAANVDGTREILRLAALGALKPVHFISTLSVFFGDRYAGHAALESELPPLDGALPPGGYPQSKLVAEHLMATAQGRGLPVAVYRLPFVGWHSGSGAYNGEDLLTRLCVACLKLGSAPPLDIGVSMAPVDEVVRALVHLSRSSAAIGQRFHLGIGEPVPWRELVAWLQPELQWLSYGAWRAQLVAAAASDPSLRALVPLLGADERALLATRIPSRARAPRFDDAQARQTLGDAAIARAPLDAARVAVFVAELARRGALGRGRSAPPSSPEPRRRAFADDLELEAAPRLPG
jgi:thioester reductase-like protein